MTIEKLATEIQTEEREESTETIYRSIRERICLGDFRPGAVLSENALAAEFGVSRAPIRRVLQRLEFEKLVTTKPNLGTMVSILNVISLKEVYDLRLKLAEVLGDLYPTIRISETDLAYFDELLQRCRLMYGQANPRGLLTINMEFHERTMGLVPNRYLRQFFSQLYYQTTALWVQLLHGLDWDTEVRAMEEEYLATIECLRRGDMHGAALIRRDHIERSLSRIRAYLGGT